MRGRSIRHKLILVSMGATTAALLLACILLRAYDQRAFRDSEIAGLEALASTVAAGSGAALSFDDRATATQALETLRSHANLVNQRVAVGLLTRAGHHVTLASNGLDPRPLPSRRSA